ncbi:MAG TPA: lysophospholipid acyltransferase family protein [bacterium]|nr:lysophospholipid acyltransferase family protein [bacterium]
MTRTPPLPDYKAFSIHHPASLKPLRQGAVYVVVRGLVFLAGRLSLRALQRLGRVLGRLVYRFSARYRRLAHLQLAMALPELSEAERTRIARQCMEHQGMTLLETIALPRLRRRPTPWLRLENEELLVAAHARGRGVVLVTAHAANWELLPIALERLRIRAMAVASTLTNPRLNRLIGEIRRFEYMDVAERGSETSPRQLLGCLKRGDALVLVNDVDIEAQGVFVDFFGIPANTPRAPASLALKLDTPLLTYFDTRLPDGSHVLRFQEVPITEAIRTAADPVRSLTQAVSDQVEAHIRAHPEQWMWNHRRWKRRPPDEAGGVPGPGAAKTG